MKDYFNKFKEMNRNLHPAAKIIYGILIAAVFAGVILKVFNKPEMLLIVVGLYVGIVFHEVAHGYAALWMGDPTAKIWGRLNFNPAKHIDPVGIILPIVLIMINAPFVLGWAKPVPVNYNLLRKKKSGLFFVAIAGVFVNAIIVILSIIVLRFMPKENVVNGFESIGGAGHVNIFNPINILIVAVIYILIVNLGLAIFNLIPIPPLDGSKILEAFGGEKVRNFIESMDKFGFVIIIVLLYFGILDKLLSPVFSFVLTTVYRAIGI